jgi:uncharacterized repeat protein (TIGR03803 family)
VTFDSSGNLFGTTTEGGANSDGTVFEILARGTFPVTVASFNGTDGSDPVAAVTFDSAGNLFGTTSAGGASGDGTIFEIPKGSTSITTLVNFDGANGSNPHAAVTIDSSGNLFGTTVGGGRDSDGTIFEIPRGSLSFTTIASLTGDDGAGLDAPVTFDASGNLFGTTEAGGAAGQGTVFEIAKGSNSVTTVASLSGIEFSPVTAVSFDPDGNLYGTTFIGGLSDNGTLFEIAKGTTSITTIASFDGTNGSSPNSVTFDSNGDLFGTTTQGGVDIRGTLFEIPKGSTSLTTIANFNGTNGYEPSAVTFDSSGDLFGTTEEGAPGYDSGYAAPNDGTVFEVSKGSTSITTVSYFDTVNLTEPESAVMFDSGGDLFGTTVQGGADDDGSVFEIRAGSTVVTTVASFDGDNGANPYAGVTIDSAGNLFGTSENGGAADNGTVFEIANGSTSITTLATFDGANGAFPWGGVTFDSNGNLFGTTVNGGNDQDGTIFEIPKVGASLTSLASFSGTDGANPYDPVTFDSRGNLFGTTNYGGLGYQSGDLFSGDGTVFEMPKGTTSLTLKQAYSLIA